MNNSKGLWEYSYFLSIQTFTVHERILKFSCPQFHKLKDAACSKVLGDSLHRRDAKFKIQAYVFRFVKLNLKSLRLQLKYILYCECVCMLGVCFCVCQHAQPLVFWCILCSVRGDVESCLSPSALSPGKLPPGGKRECEGGEMVERQKKMKNEEVMRKNRRAPSFCSLSFVSSFLALAF